MKTLAVLFFLAAQSAVDLPRIGCWREPKDDAAARGLYGLPGNLAVRGEESCDNSEEYSARDADGVRTLRLNPHWRLAESAAGERFLLYRDTERYELPQ